jgi:tRNA(Ile)-lysidine synthase
MSKKEDNKLPLKQRMLEFIREHRLVEENSCLLVAVSGGADSICMLQALLELKNELNIELHIAHLNHQLRGADSESDAIYIDGLARRLGIPATTVTRDVLKHQAEKHLCLEEAAREVRYTFLAETALSLGANRVAVGHTSDDNIETILMHLIRGTGLKGLVGLKPLVRWRPAGGDFVIIRPLLTVSREETAAYCREHTLEIRIDASNLALSPLRNRIRQQLLPILTEYNPGIEQAILRLSRIVSDDITFMEKEVKSLWNKVAHVQPGTVSLDKMGFLEIPSALQRHLLRMAFDRLLGNLKDIETRHIEIIMEALSKPAGRKLNLPGGLIFMIEYKRYLLGAEPENLCPIPPLNGDWPLNIPGRSTLPGWNVEAQIVGHEKMLEERDNQYRAFLDLDAAGDRLLVRTRRHGDRFQPLGMDKQKKLGKFMIDARIPAVWRNRVPLVYSDSRILWVVGWRIDDRFKVTRDSSRIIQLNFEKL